VTPSTTSISAQAVEEQVQRALGRDSRIELAQAARSGVARIGKGLVAAPGLPAVQGLERAAGHEDLAPRFQHRRQTLAPQLQRHRADCADIDRHVLAARAVAPRRGLHQAAVFVAHGDCQAVDLRLGRIGDLVDVEPFARAPVEIDDVLLGERIVERQHRRCVHDFAEFTRRLSADPLRR
jgi:hypothetical protein